jgi:hypothetical protein
LCSLAETPAVRGFGFCTRVAADHLRPANIAVLEAPAPGCAA